MRISINLATRPFIELRPLFARLRLAMAGLAVLAIALGVWLHFLNQRAQAAQAQMDALQAQTAEIQMERQRNEARMREPQNQAVLDRSVFLNNLFEAKSFSWTSVMMDLERVLPAGVQVTSIEPVISVDHEVTIRLRVTGERERAVQLVRNLERSQRFLAPRLANETAQTQEPGKMAQFGAVPGGVEFEISSGYNPLAVPVKVVDVNGTASDVTTPSASVTSTVAMPAGKRGPR
jgi:type IV pilus assembly protein PilN